MPEHLRDLDELLIHGREGEVFHHVDGCSDCKTALLERQAYPPGCGHPLLGYRVLLHLDLLCDDDPSLPLDLRAHAERCAACRAEVADGRRVLAEPLTPEDGPRGCTLCLSSLQTGESVYCASCQAPHHAACFELHEQCATPGCPDARYVQPLRRDAQRKPGSLRRWFFGGLLGLVASTGAVSSQSGGPLQSSSLSPQGSEQAPGLRVHRGLAASAVAHREASGLAA